jgi:hypothetical protein
MNFRKMILLIAALLLTPAIASASLSEFFSATGKLTLSVDGAGSNNANGHTIQVEKPNASATVRKAFVLAASTGFSGRVLANGDVSINGTPVNWTSQAAGAISNFNHLADVTSIVKPTIDAASPGRVTFTFTEVNTTGIDGEVLAVVFDDPAQTRDTTVVLLFGSQAIAGDNFAITLAEPINPATAGALADMGLGISFSFQPSGQLSIVDVNNQRLTSSAGGQDDEQDAVAQNGGLITVGGLDDSNANPANPNGNDNCGSAPRCDDELYSLLPFITANDTTISVHTQNPSNDDNIFFAYFHLSGAAIVGQGIVLGPTDATNPVGTQHTVTAKVTDSQGQPVSGIVVSFEVLSGPNDVKSGTDTTDANGEATFTYTDDGGAGTDQIQASFLVSAEETKFSNIVTKTWGSSENNAPTADPQSVTTAEDTPKVITLTGSDPDTGDTLTFSIVDQPQHGTLSAITPSTAKQTANARKLKQKQNQKKVKVKAVPGSAPVPDKKTLAAIVQATISNNVTYTPDHNYNGPDSFTFKVNDGTVDSAKATVTINVTPVADPIDIQAIDFVRRTGTSAGYTYSSPGIAAVAKLLNPDGDSTADFAILTIRALNLPKNCGSNVVKSDEIDLAPPIIRETVPVSDNPDSEDPADTQGEIKVLEIGPAAIAAAGNCAVTLQLTAFSMQIDDLPSTTVTLDQPVCVDSDGGAAYSCVAVTTLAEKNSASRAASVPAGSIKIAPPRFR